jgi:hypothetical protein
MVAMFFMVQSPYTKLLVSETVCVNCLLSGKPAFLVPATVISRWGQKDYNGWKIGTDKARSLVTYRIRWCLHPL